MRDVKNTQKENSEKNIIKIEQNKRTVSVDLDGCRSPEKSGTGADYAAYSC